MAANGGGRAALKRADNAKKKSETKKRGGERKKKYKRVSPVVEKGRQKCEGTRVKLGKADANATAEVRVTHDC